MSSDPKTETAKADAEAKPDAEKTEEKPATPEPPSRFVKPISNVITVAGQRPPSFYTQRCRRALRYQTTCTLAARGTTIDVACLAVEQLKKQGVAVVTKMTTGMSVEPFFTGKGDARWGEPTSMISFQLARGEFATCVADYQQRKVIDLFEKHDKDKTGLLSFAVIEGLKMAEAFESNADQAKKADSVMKDYGIKGKLDLPGFIRYASALIDPLLKTSVFKNVMVEKFGVLDKKAQAEADAAAAKAAAAASEEEAAAGKETAP